MTLTNLYKTTATPFCASYTLGGRSLNLTVFCDFDGPLVDVSDRYYETYKQAIAHTQRTYLNQGQSLPLCLLKKAQFWRMKRERVSDIEIAMRSGLQEEEITFFLDYVQQIVNETELLHRDQMQIGVNWSLGLLHSYGVKLVIVTLREESQVRTMLDQYGLRRLFSGIYGSHDQQIAYQNNAEFKSALLQKAIAEQGHMSDHWVMVGDTEADIIAAKKSSIPSIAVTCGIRDEDYLKKYQPDYLCQDLLCVAHLVRKRYGRSYNSTDRLSLSLGNYCLSNSLI